MRPINYSDPIYLKFQNRLEPEEKIFFTYKEIEGYKRNISISLPVFIICLSILLITYNFRYIPIFFLISIISALICLCSFVFVGAGITDKYRIGDIFHIFTDKKIIVESMDIGIGILIVVIGFLWILFSLSFFDSLFQGTMTIQDWVIPLKFIFIIIGIVIVISGVKKIIQDIIH